MAEAPQDLKTTPLHGLHLELGARMVGFAGYSMPVQYKGGILEEHRHTRAAAGLFDVSHMGQATLEGPDAAAALETLVPGDLTGLAPGQMRYTLLLDESAGIIDDLMATRPAEAGGRIFLVVNAGCKEGDFAHIAARLAGRARLLPLADRGLLALQGPRAEAVLARLSPGMETLGFMHAREAAVAGTPCFISRSGYTGEDGFEISVPAEAAEALARRLLAEPEVAPIGLGARDLLRLEAGLCLWGHDIDRATTPVEAGLAWAIARRRRAEGGFPGHAVVMRQLGQGPARRRVGLIPEGRAPAREGTEVADAGGRVVGRITSGGFGPTLGGPLAMGYVEARHAAERTEVALMVRGKALPARVAPMPFVPHRYKR